MLWLGACRNLALHVPEEQWFSFREVSVCSDFENYHWKSVSTVLIANRSKKCFCGEKAVLNPRAFSPAVTGVLLCSGEVWVLLIACQNHSPILRCPRPAISLGAFPSFVDLSCLTHRENNACLTDSCVTPALVPSACFVLSWCSTSLCAKQWCSISPLTPSIMGFSGPLPTIAESLGNKIFSRIPSPFQPRDFHVCEFPPKCLPHADLFMHASLLFVQSGVLNFHLILKYFSCSF